MDKKVQVFIFDKEDISRTLIKSYLQDVDFIDSVKIIQDTDDISEISLDDYNTVVIADITENTEDVLDEIRLVTEQEKRINFIAISYNVTTDFIIRAFKNGIREFISKPLIKDELIKAIEKAANYENRSSEDEAKGKIISVFSSKGGLGKTTVAVNLAKSLADIYKEKVAIVDLNMHLGDVTAFLDINPTYDIKYVSDNVDKADEDFLISTLERYKDSNLYILADSPYREPVDSMTTKDIAKLLRALKKFFSFVIIDNSSNIDPKTTTVFDESDLVLYIATANLPVIRNSKRSLELFDKLGYANDKIKIIINRFINSEGYKIEDIEETINKKIFWKLPNNYFAVIEAVNKGLTLQEVNESSNIAQEYIQLAQAIKLLPSVNQKDVNLT